MAARAGRRALTRKERDVALLLAQGCQPAQVGIALGISERIVKRHISVITRKLGVRSGGRSWLRRLEKVMARPTGARQVPGGC